MKQLIRVATTCWIVLLVMTIIGVFLVLPFLGAGGVLGAVLTRVFPWEWGFGFFLIEAKFILQLVRYRRDEPLTRIPTRSTILEMADSDPISPTDTMYNSYASFYAGAALIWPVILVALYYFLHI